MCFFLWVCQYDIVIWPIVHIDILTNAALVDIRYKAV